MGVEVVTIAASLTVSVPEAVAREPFSRFQLNGAQRL
jgi:hypothetical protein